MTGYPSWFSRRFITWIVALLFVTGLGLLPTTLTIVLDWELPWRLQASQRDWVVIAHVLVGFLFVAVMGMLWSIHMRSGWRRRLRQLTGALVTSFATLLVLSGIGLWYVVNETALHTIAMTHAVLGFAILGLYLAHARARSVNTVGLSRE